MTESTSSSGCRSRTPKWAREMFGQLHQELVEIRRQLEDIQLGEGIIMAEVAVQQEDIDAVGTKIEAVVTAIDGIDTTQLPAGTFDAVNTALADLTEHVNAKLPVTAPVTPPADGGDTPPVDDGGDTPAPDANTPVQ